MSEEKTEMTLVHDQQKNFELMQRRARLLSASDLVPTQYQGGTPAATANCIIAMQLADRIGADYLMVMQNLFVIKGKPSWSSQFIISAINSCGRFSPLNFVVTGTGQDMACKATATEKATGELIEGPLVTMAMAKQEGWIDKPGSKWKTMPEVMIRYRAASFFGKLYAPEILNGMGTVEEVYDSDPIDVTPEPKKSTAETIKEKLKEKIKPGENQEPQEDNNPDSEPEKSENGELEIF